VRYPHLKYSRMKFGCYPVWCTVPVPFISLSTP
jgi:hypothetical protein